MIDLKRLNIMVKHLEAYSSTEIKKAVLKNYPDMSELLKIIYDPLFTFNITGKRIQNLEYTPKIIKDYTCIVDLLKDLNNRVYTGEDAINACWSFMQKNEPYEDLIIKILNKDLECGINVKTINKVFNKLIPEFNVPLAHDWKSELTFFSNTWYYSRKLDGLRLLTFITEDEIKFFTRNGHEVFTLDVLKQHIQNNYYGSKPIILDGELCITNEQGDENFQAILREYRKKDHTIKNPRYFIFDYYTPKEFQEGWSETPYDEKTFCILENKVIKILDQRIVPNEATLIFIMNTLPRTWEGLMLRKNVPTHFKRTNFLLKVKKFKEEEFHVIGVNTGEKTINGKKLTCIGSIQIKYKNNIVDIGSGLTDDERLDWYENPSKIIGKLITVKYFKESIDKNGNVSLRFPILKCVWRKGEKE